jgi:hypothetical protein
MPFMGFRFLSFALFFVFLLNQNVFAQTPAQTDVQALKTEIDALKADYEKRIQALEEKLSVLQGGATPAQQPPPEPPPEQLTAPSGGVTGPQSTMRRYSIRTSP